MSNGDPVSTGIFKEPVAGRVMLRTPNLDGDRQADLSVHG
jgi:MOSC domain-containing protein YiiM